MSGRLLIVLCMVAAIVVAHVFLWRSDMALGPKLAFTAMNAVSWTIIIAPILFVDRWLDAILRRNARAKETETRPPH